jgi:acyl dehydratase
MKVGDTREAVVADGVTRTQVVMYAGASGDYSPLHTDELAARVAGHPGLMAHGMLTMGATARLLTDWFGPEALTEYAVRFVAPVFPGAVLTARGTVVAVRGREVDVEISTSTQEGITVITGTATAVLDDERDTP